MAGSMAVRSVARWRTTTAVAASLSETSARLLSIISAAPAISSCAVARSTSARPAATATAASANVVRRSFLVLVMLRPSQQGAATATGISARGHSHSMVPGGFEVMSMVTRLISATSLVMRVEIFSITS